MQDQESGEGVAMNSAGLSKKRIVYAFVYGLFFVATLFSFDGATRDICTPGSNCSVFDFYAPNYSYTFPALGVYGIDMQNDSYGNTLIVSGHNKSLTTDNNLLLTYYAQGVFTPLDALSVSNSSWIRLVAFHPTKPFVAVGKFNNSNSQPVQVLVYDVSGYTLNLIYTVDIPNPVGGFGPTTGILGLVWNPAGTQLAVLANTSISSLNVQGTLYVYNVDQVTGALTQLATTGPIYGSSSSVLIGPGYVAWDPTGTFIAVGYNDTTAGTKTLSVFALSSDVYPASLISAGTTSFTQNVQSLVWAPNQNILVNLQITSSSLNIFSYVYNALNPASSVLAQRVTSITDGPPFGANAVRWQNSTCFMVGMQSGGASATYPAFSMYNFNQLTGAVGSTGTKIFLPRISGSTGADNVLFFPNGQDLLLVYATSGSTGAMTVYPIIPGGPDPIDLTITQNASSAYPSPGDVITYTITVANHGPVSTMGVQVFDVLPVGVSYVSSSATVGSYDSLTGGWFIDAMNAGDVQTLTITVTVTASLGTVITNTATVSDPYSCDFYPGSNTASTTIRVVNKVDLVITKSVNNPLPRVNQEIVYTIAVVNNGPSAAGYVEAIDLLPAGVAYITSSVTKGSYNALSGIWSIGALAPGESVTLTITCLVTLSRAGQQVVNTATVSDPYDFDLYPSSNSASATIFVIPDADLFLTKQANGATFVAGQNVVYTLQITNYGPNTASSIQVIDHLSTDLSYITSSASQGVYEPIAGIWQVGSLVPFASATLTITANVLSTAIGKALVNTAYALDAYSTDIYQGGNSATVTIDVVANSVQAQSFLLWRVISGPQL